ncbi:iron-sulfur cluster assembly protein [Actinoplanes sp. NPDC049548]|uniref:iron-sulfur cluster assembly protein n=1 Tax=Actinoplanes sp. NPDC049548 TaxID=3155152 RepID=UPI00341D92B4
MNASAVQAALATVRDPELDRPITELGFVAAIEITTDRVRVELRLPTYFCAPNFAWLMVADARDAVAAVPGVRVAEVVLLEHFVAAEINAGVAAAGDFAASFRSDGLDPALAELRLTFERKAHTAAQERLARALAAAGAEDLGGLAMEEALRIAPSPAAAVGRRRAALGITSTYALCDDAGQPFPAERLPGWLRLARTVRVSIDGNAVFCRGLLETRYGLARSA